MKNARPYPRAKITPKAERAVLAGHPWVYDAEVLSLEDANGAVAASADGENVPNGSLVDVVNRKGAYLGTGMLSIQSKIRIRLITRNANDRFDQAFWERKVRWAWEYRKTVMGDAAVGGASFDGASNMALPTGGLASDLSSCRVIFSEADGFPGLIVDKFEDVLVAQVLTVGMERAKPAIFAALRAVFADEGIPIRGIYERNDVSTRKLEGLDEACGWYDEGARAFEKSAADASGVPQENAIERSTSVQIVENGVRYLVDFENGQKTGFFLDQKYNRRAVARLAAGKRVLDCFTHTGSFALNAACAGAQSVTAVDISQRAIDQARANAQLNGVEDCMTFVCANVFDLLTELEQQRIAGQHRTANFDFIILDPPAFTKSRRNIDAALRGYKDINYRALRILPRGGYLATCSCSHFMDTERFKGMMASAALDAGVQLRQIEQRQQAPDHPIVWGIPETDYLKFFLFQVV